jgi:hypothetical protein
LCTKWLAAFVCVDWMARMVGVDSVDIMGTQDEYFLWALGVNQCFIRAMSTGSAGSLADDSDDVELASCSIFCCIILKMYYFILWWVGDPHAWAACIYCKYVCCHSCPSINAACMLLLIVGALSDGLIL